MREKYLPDNMLRGLLVLWIGVGALGWPSFTAFFEPAVWGMPLSPKAGNDLQAGFVGPNAVPVGANDFRISQMGPDGNPNFSAQEPAVAYNRQRHEYFAVWTGEDSNDNEFEIYGQRLDAWTGSPRGPELRLSDMGPDGDTRYAAYFPSVAYNSVNEQYLVTWYGDDNTAPLVDDEFEVFGQLVNGDGSEIGGNDFQISSAGPDGDANFDALYPRLTFNQVENEYFVVWRADDQAGSLVNNEFEIYGQRLSSTGDPLGPLTRVSITGPDGNPNYETYESAVVFNAQTNEYLVVWSADDSSSILANDEFEIYAQRVSGSNGARLGSRIRISDMGPDTNSDFDAYKPAAAYNSQTNEYLIVWQGDDNSGLLANDEFEIFSQRLDASGAELSPNDVRLSDMGPDGSSAYHAFQPSVIYNAAENEYLVTWYGDDNTGALVSGELEVYAQRVGATQAQLGGNDVRLSESGPDGSDAYVALLPSVAYNSQSNEYLAVWQGGSNVPPLTFGEAEVFGQRFLAVARLYLPLTLRNYIAYYAGLLETEPNNTASQANGPLRSGQVYQGAPNDDRDYFSVYLPVAGTLNISLTGHTGSGVQLQLYYQTAGNVVAFDTAAPYQLSYSGGPGLYYVYIFSAGNYSPTPAYNLVVTYPTE